MDRKDRNELLNEMQGQVRLLHDAVEQYKYQFDLETLSRLSEPLSEVTQSITEIERAIRMLKYLTNKPQSKDEQL